ncbi:ATP12 family chaperone protein [Brevundimonas subvibrioides]|uniref:ATP12 ATPase n=1 Tax=Brevundimonas subvibrioides (strain ATCC 15264 / DSM 4735 / LMG 14903 / NBRC 16000 / CB 81) TaxID=633149 RepID=D9QGQ1_BRESC|nr:ATP12 family protein [Brevundimonas subvibrioides]ADL00867.1 ATP12 ATPase [Brevundimonas subvibrioides ATCC 15264]
MSHIPPLDPRVAAKKGFRESEERLKRFWKDASVAPDGEGHVVLLDGRAPKTPAHARMVLPTEAAARLVADEWAAQGEFIEPGTMPATRLAATAIDRVSQTREPVADEIASYVGSDLLCYLAEHPTNLVAEQARDWAPWRHWAGAELGVHVEATQGIIHRPQPPETLARVKTLALELDDFALTGLATAVPLFGSAILGLAVQRGALSGAAAFEISRLDEAFQERQWGVDADNAERTEARRAEAALLDRWFRAL